MIYSCYLFMINTNQFLLLQNKTKNKLYQLNQIIQTFRLLLNDIHLTGIL